MRILIPLFLIFAMNASAEIYKCTNNGRTVFSDKPCGDSAEVVDVSASERKTGTKFSDDQMEALGSEMGKERRMGELDRAISNQERKIDKILDDYNQKKSRLEKELADHRNSKDYNSWKNHEYKRERYYEKKRDLENQINAAYREYRADREKAYNKLYALRKERRNVK